MRFMNGLSINQLGKESNSLKIGSQAERVNTPCVMDKKIPKFQNSKGELANDQ